MSIDLSGEHMPSMTGTTAQALIIGANGAMGTLLSRHFSELGVRVTAFDCDEQPAPGARYVRYISSDITKSAREAAAVVGVFDYVIVALPEPVAIEALVQIAPRLPPKTLLVDTLSVKSAVIQHVKPRLSRGEWLSINPMFGPGIGFYSQPVLAVQVAGGPRAREFAGWLEKKGARLYFLSAEGHDRRCATFQVLTHASVLSFGAALSSLGCNIETAIQQATPPHLSLLSLLARILTLTPEVYWDIQKSNPYAPEARAAAAEGLRELHEVITAGDFSEFSKFFETLRALMGPELTRLSSNCSKLFERQAGYFHDSLPAKPPQSRPSSNY